MKLQIKVSEEYYINLSILLLYISVNNYFAIINFYIITVLSHNFDGLL